MIHKEQEICCARNEKRQFVSSRSTKTCTKDEAEAYFCTFFFAFSNTFSDSSKKLAGCGTKTTFAKGCSEFHNFKEDDCVVQARNSCSRKRWSSGIQEIESRIYIELLTVTTLVSSIMVKIFGNWRRSQEKIPVFY